MTPPSSLTIGQLADAAGMGVGVETVRFYERRGLVAEPPRTPGGYRQYPPETVQRLRFIRRAQRLGFTLDEIRELLGLRVVRDDPCEDVAATARAKMEDVGAKIAELEAIRGALRRLVRACGERRPTGECAILEELEGSTSSP